MVTEKSKESVAKIVRYSLLGQGIDDIKIAFEQELRELTDCKAELTKEEAYNALKYLFKECPVIQFPFGQIVEEIMKILGITKNYRGKVILDISRASKMTKLSKDTFYHSIHNSDTVIGMPMVVSIIIGFKLNVGLVDRLLQSAGLSFRLDNREHLAYMYLIYYCRDLDIDQCNEILKKFGIGKRGLLGSHSRGKNGEQLEYKQRTKKNKNGF